ncbi:SVSP family protein [Theileria parva strain Muguga]|uniref:Uncharacterized protein n=1 Tax=Theileria parva TaxID=5875 RepID=Q4N0V2_THEPA|nr:SVSP family protein [Theileria parva strain Muguga]EAN30741.1 SVSP family protein [Theileria parva strain Muguga]|eukprot:XP_763024.1 hypothetical protein [Theileria parva strain Muguga]
MNKNISHNFILILIVIKYVESADNNPNQPAPEDEEEDNFEVLDLSETGQQTNPTENPEHPAPYQQISELLYLQTESQLEQQSQPQPQHYGTYQPYQAQTQTQQQQTDTYWYYEPPQIQTITQQQLEQLHQEPQYHYYVPEYTDPYGSQQQSTQSQPSQLLTQPTQEQSIHYVPTLVSQAQQPTGKPPVIYMVLSKVQLQLPTYYSPATIIQTQQTAEQLEPEVIEVQSIEESFEEKLVTQEMDRLLDKLKEKVGQTDKTQPGKRKRTRTTSGNQGEDDDGQEPVKRKDPKPQRKIKKLKFYKKDCEGNLVEMTGRDYGVIFSNSNKAKYIFNACLEQIERGNEIIYVHSQRVPYCSLLRYSKPNDIIVMTNSDGFTLVKKSKGIWTRTDHVIPDYVKFYTRDLGGNYVLITSDQYNIDFTSDRSFRYEFFPGVKCHKIVVTGMIAWKKTDNDADYPLAIYVTSALDVIVNFEGYSKMYRKRLKRYNLVLNKPSIGKRKYT